MSFDAQELTPAIDDSSGIAFVEETSVNIYEVGQSFSAPPTERADWVVNVSLALRVPLSFDTVTMTLQFPELGASNKFSFKEGISPSSNNAPVWVSALRRIPDIVPQRWRIAKALQPVDNA